VRVKKVINEISKHRYFRMAHTVVLIAKIIKKPLLTELCKGLLKNLFFPQNLPTFAPENN
jgi:hypothetical protein